MRKVNSEKDSTWREIRQVQKEGERKVSRLISLYNLDVVISVGYRVKSKIGTEFLKWSNQKIKDYLLKGYAINLKLLEREKNQVIKLKRELNYLNHKTLYSQKQLTEGFLSIITTYSKSFELLNEYDKNDLSTDNLAENVIYTINYNDVKKAIGKLKDTLILKREASALFGNEKVGSFKGILGSISQTVFGELAYPSIEEQAAQLFYSVIKGHPFSDGNKRIGSSLFVWF